MEDRKQPSVSQMMGKMMVDRIRKILMPFTWIVMIPCALSGHGLRFEKEKITITVSDSEVRLTGEYYFRNSSPDTDRSWIQYPFVVLPLQPFPDFIEVSDVTGGRPITHQIESDGIRFRIEANPFDLRVIKIVYRQPVRSKRFEYLLKTTASWGASLRLAEYRILLPLDCELKSCSFPFDTIKQKNGHVLYWMRRENFLPEENLVFHWKVSYER
jgi:hypothetical protein